MKLILASGSPYRRALLERLHLPFESVSPDVDESPRQGELADSLAMRLAERKMLAVHHRHPEAAVIGSDQVACLDGQLLGKPGNPRRAAEQLRASSGRSVTFYTGLSVIRPGYEAHGETVETRVHFRELSDREIDRYLELEQPYDCAGSFKCEGLGISLFQRLEGDDPTALEGLPLIALTRMLGLLDLHPLLTPTPLQEL